MKLRTVMGLGANIGMGCALLCHFFLIVAYGKFYIQEPNQMILWVEIIGIISIIALNIFNTIADRRMK